MRKKMMAGLLGVVSLLAMTATESHAYPTCNQGHVVSAIAGYWNASTWGNCEYMLKLSCNDTSGDLAGKSGIYCGHRGIAPDRIWSLALLAIEMQGTVGYQLYTHDKTGIYGDGLLLTLWGVVP